MSAFERTERSSVVQTRAYWFVACLSAELRGPKQIVLWGEKIVLFRDAQGTARALLDRCSHRNVPLSEGTCVQGNIQCPYHGWQFDGEGNCVHIPALVGQPSPHPKRKIPSYHVCEQQDHVWIYGDPNSVPNHRPYLFPHYTDPKYTNITYQSDFVGSVYANVENILDVPHTAFLHKGLFRGVKSNIVDTIVRRYHDRAECQYVGEPRPSGLLGSILAPSGGEVEHFDRFILPSIAQVEYKLGDRNIVVSSALRPISDTEVRLYAVVAVKLRIWAPLLRPFVLPFAIQVLRQDQKMLAKQQQCIADFGGENFNYTEVDVLGPSIMRLLKRASQENMVLYTEDTEEPETVLKGKLQA